MIAIIPARGGSKGVLRKNIKLLGGKPLILWTIEAAIKASNVDRVILSTDDEEIVEICKSTGIEIPFMRPKELAQDDSLAIDNYIYTMARLANEFNYDKDEFAVLLPTVPFRNTYDIDSSIKLFFDKDADSVISCTQLTHPLTWVCSVDDEGRIEKDQDSEAKKMMNRQESSPRYIPNGGVYILKHSLLKEKYSYYSDKTYAYIMPAERSIDIDTEFDFEFAEFMVKKTWKT
ncbi:acylneuraminate cytidylyltransferase family protein [bacterium]|nr:acylneuraminate cytidylyltransferase family protein [bacterium]